MTTMMLNLSEYLAKNLLTVLRWAVKSP